MYSVDDKLYVSKHQCWYVYLHRMVLSVILDEYKMSGHKCTLCKLELINLIMCFGFFCLVLVMIRKLKKK